MRPDSSLREGPPCGTTKQSSRFNKLKTPSQSRGWIATARFTGLAVTNKNQQHHAPL